MHSLLVILLGSTDGGGLGRGARKSARIEPIQDPIRTLARMDRAKSIDSVAA